MRPLLTAVALVATLVFTGCGWETEVVGPNTIRANHNGDVDDAIAQCSGGVADLREVGSDYIVICQGGVKR